MSNTTTVIEIKPASAENAASFDPHAYTIVIRRVVLDGEPVFHGRVIELPDLESFEPTYEEAYGFLIEGIRNAKAAFVEQGRQFPSPLPDETPDYSGRATIRMPAWLHAQLDFCANAQQTSLNQYMVTLLSWAVAAAPKWTAQNVVVGSEHQNWLVATEVTRAGTMSQLAAIYGAGGAHLTVGATLVPVIGFQGLPGAQFTFQSDDMTIGQNIAAHIVPKVPVHARVADEGRARRPSMRRVR